MSQGFASSQAARSAFQELAWREPTGLSFIGGANSSNTTSHSLTVPGSAATGDLALICFAGANSVPSTPTGGGTWTLVWSEDLLSNEYQGIWYKVVTGSEPASWSLSTTGADSGAIAVVYRGVDTIKDSYWEVADTANFEVTPAPFSFQLIVWMQITATSQFTAPTGATNDYSFRGVNTNNSDFLAMSRPTRNVFDLPRGMAVGNGGTQYTTNTCLIVT